MSHDDSRPGTAGIHEFSSMLDVPSVTPMTTEERVLDLDELLELCLNEFDEESHRLFILSSIRHFLSLLVVSLTVFMFILIGVSPFCKIFLLLETSMVMGLLNITNSGMLLACYRYPACSVFSSLPPTSVYFLFSFCGQVNSAPCRSIALRKGDQSNVQADDQTE
jgi:hypothetical protein